MNKKLFEKKIEKFLTITDTINNERIKDLFFKKEKNDKDTINESLGYPNEIDMMVEILTDLIINVIQTSIDNQEYGIKDIEIPDYGGWEIKYDTIFLEGDKVWDFVTKSPKFNEEEWKKFPLKENDLDVKYQVLPEIVFKNKNKKSPQIGGAHSFEPKKIMVKGYESTIENYNVGNFEFDLIVNEKQIDNLNSIRNDISSVVAHEIFHAFQLFMRYKNTKTIGYGKEGVYNVLTNIVKAKMSNSWNNFIYCLYLSLRFEHQARVPQIFKELKDSDIKNYQDFIREVKKTNVWHEIETLRSFSSQDFKNELSKIENFEDILFKPFKELEINQNINNWNDFLKSIQGELFKRGLSVTKIKGLNPEVVKNPSHFFDYWEKRFHQRAEELLRKISKLYFLLKK